MKILLIVFCFTSIRSLLGVHGLASPQWLNSFRRKLYVPNQYQRVNPDLAKLIFLKQLLELDSIRNIYLKNCQIPHQFPKHQKLPLSTRLNSMSAVRNNVMHPPTSNGVQKKHFINPKIIILPPWTSNEETFVNNFQNHKELNYKKNPPHYSRIIPADREKTEATDGKNEESFLKQIHGEDSRANLENYKSYVPKNLTLQGNKKVTFADEQIHGLPMHSNFKHQSNMTYPTPNLLSHLKSSPTRIHEVEEIVEGTVNVSENNLKKLSMGERPYFENTVSRDKQEQKVLDNSILTIIKEMTEQVTNSPPTENMLSEVFGSASSKVPSVQTTTPIQSQHFFRVLPSDATKAINKKTFFPVKTNLTAKKYPSHRITQLPHLFSINKPDDEQEAHKIFEVTPSVATNHLKHTIPDEGHTQRTESKGFEIFPHTFFGFFNKESTENSRKRPETISEKIRLNPFTLPSIPPKLSDEIPQDLFKNLITNDLNLKMANNEPPNSATESFSQTFTDSVQIDNVTLVPLTGATNTKPNSTFKLNSHNSGEVKTTTFKTAQDKKDRPLTTSSSILRNSNSTTSNVRKLSEGPLSIDLLSSTTKPELKKDQESSGKNSRKMNFNQNTQKETTFNRITETSDPHPRRSDILITDYADDYKDNENRFSNLSYLDRIKSNDTILTDRNINSYIPLLPEIINDIRRNKISDEDLSLLSKVFEKYWPNILALSNNKELDILPLLTMKNEKDLITFMESHFSNESKTSTIKIDDVKVDNKDSLKHSYDYDGAYEDLYDYVLGHELREKRKQYRHKRDDELEYQKLEANMEYFESLAEEQRIGKIEYMVEYAMYDESLEDDNISVLELIKPADLYVTQKNETLRKEQN